MATSAASQPTPRALPTFALRLTSVYSAGWAVYLAVVIVHLLAGILVGQLTPPGPLSTLGIYFDDAMRMAQGQVPYRDFTLEYPPLSIPFFWLPLLGGHSMDTYRPLFAQEIMLVDLLGALITVWAIRRFHLNGAFWAVLIAQPLWLLAADHSIIFERYDLVPGVACLAAIVLLAARKDRWAWVVLGIATALKLYPAVLGPIFLIVVWQRREKSELAMDVLACAWAVVLPSVAAVRGDVPALWTFVTYHLDRGLEIESFWANVLMLGHLVGLPVLHVHGAGSEEVEAPLSDVLAGLSLPLTVLALFGVYAVGWRTLRGLADDAAVLTRVTRLSLAATLVFMLGGKVLSPQYLLWLYPLVPLVGGTWITAAVLFGGALLFSRWLYPDHWTDLVTFQPTEIVVLTVRNALLVGIGALALSPRSGDRWRLAKSWRASGTRDVVAASGAAAVVALCLFVLGWPQQWLPALVTAVGQSDLVKTYVPGHGYLITRAPQLPVIAADQEAQLPHLGSESSRLGTTGGRLDDPRAVAVGASGTVYVLESTAKEVVAFDASGQRLDFALHGTPAGVALEEPVDLAVDPEGNLDVLDSGRSVVERFGPDGTYRQTLALAQFTVYHPRGLFIDPQGNLYIADTGGSRVLEVSSAGRMLRQWNNQNGYDLDQPTGVAADAAGNVYVTEPTRGRLDEIAPDGIVVAVRHMDTADTLKGPHLAVAPTGQVVMTDPVRHNVVILSPTLDETALVGQPSMPLQDPVGVTVSADGAYWIADADAGQVVRVSP